MKISIKFLLLLGLSTTAFSDETMCFKKNFTDLETINKVKLDGGLCLGENSRDDMQKKGWSIKNIEIKDNYYIYIFKKADIQHKMIAEVKKKTVSINKDTSKEDLKQEILSELKIEKEKEIQKIKIATEIKKEEKGKKLYLNKCSSCHGLNGEIEAGYSKPLNSISLDEFKKAMNGYVIGSYDLGTASEMRPYSMGVTTSDIEAVYKYLENKK